MLSQLHSVFNTHTLIERELSTLIEQGILRKLLLRGSIETGLSGQATSSGSDVGLILSSTYIALLSSHSPLFDNFTRWIQNAGRTAVGISHAGLVEHGIHDGEINKLIEMGFLVIQHERGGTDEGYSISVPGVGGFIRSLRGGRKELLRALKRQKYKEMLEKVLF